MIDPSKEKWDNEIYFFATGLKIIPKIPKITEVRPCKPKKRHCFALDRPCAAQSRSYNTRSQHIPQHAQCGGSRSHLRNCHRLSATLAAIFLSIFSFLTRASSC